MAASSIPANARRRRNRSVSAARPTRTDSDSKAAGLQIDFAVKSRIVPLDRPACRRLLRQIAADHEIVAGEISVAIVNSATIQQLHAEYLDDETPTDVLSFGLARRGDWLEGQIVACAEVAREVARRQGRSAEAELLLYLVHGMLHLVGYDDLTAKDARVMRRQELRYAGLAGGSAT